MSTDRIMTTTNSWSPEANNVLWHMAQLKERTPGLREAVAVSSDGLPIALSPGLDRDSADRFSAVASGLIGLAYGAAGRFGGGLVNEVIVEMEHAFLFVTGMSDGSSLAVVAESDSDVATVAYHMAEVARTIGATLTPALRSELQGLLPS